MIFISTARVLKFALKNFWRHVWLSTVAITIMVLSVITLTSVFVVNEIAARIITDVKSRVDISLYFPQSTSPDQIVSYQQIIETIPEVETAEIITPEEALTRFRESHADDAGLVASLEELDENPLGGIIVVKAEHIEDYSAILKKFDENGISGLVQEIDFKDHESTITTLLMIEDRMRQFGIVLAAFFAFVSGLTVANIVRMSIYAQREEIRIMKLVGATNIFIRAPFMIEGVLSSLLACLLAWIAMGMFAQGFAPSIGGFFSGVDFSLITYLRSSGFPIFFGEFLLVALVNILSSSIALRRYINV